VSDSIEHRKQLTFEQAEGAMPLPSQLQLREVSKQLRSLLWSAVHRYLADDTVRNNYGPDFLADTWATILQDVHVYRQHRMIDDFENNARELIKETRYVFERGTYLQIFGWLEFVLKHPACPNDFADNIQSTLVYCQAAYRIVDKQVICPIASDAEHATAVKALADVSDNRFNGARAHLNNAASHLTAGKYADSVRESIHAVEAVGRTLDPTADILSKALKKLEQKISIHPAMKNGFTSLYAYTSDEKGIRHALLDDSTAKVDETDAMFMFGACASFVSYLIGKARTNGLL
jgi:hypothetical protein